MDYRFISSALAMGLTFYAFVPYISGIVRGEVLPHVFSWVIWGITTSVVFAAQLVSEGGAGAWATGVSGAITWLIAGLAWQRAAAIQISRVDWAFLVAAVSSIPLWYATANPLAAVVILTTVDLLGFGPTFRKVYHQPQSESVLFYTVFVVRNALSVVALDALTLVNWLFPVAVGLGCVVLIGLIVVRTRTLKRTGNTAQPD